MKLYPKFSQRTFSNLVAGDETGVHFFTQPESSVTKYGQPNRQVDDLTHVWYLIVSIPDLCFHYFRKRCIRYDITACHCPEPQVLYSDTVLKDIDYCPIEFIKGLTKKGQFQYLTKLMGPQEGLTCIQHDFIHYDKDQYFIIKYLIPLWDHFIAPVRKS